MKKWIRRVGISLILLCILLLTIAFLQLRDRHSGYSADIQISNGPSELSAGFAAVDITPEIIDTWNDMNDDSRYNPDDGDTYNDQNSNGKFDAHWIAGFHNSRPANGVHDKIWSRTMVIDDGQSRIALVALDVIGFGNDDVIDVRTMLPENARIDYVIITSTHSHEGPDLLGLWGPSYFKSGINADYMAFVKRRIVKSISTAADNLRPAALRFAQDLDSARYLVTDSRQPIVKDPGIRLMQVLDSAADTTLGVLFAWGNHPETLWSKNLQITSDFPHYVREGLEQGVTDHDGNIVAEGFGGIALYVSGAIGGLMTSDPDFSIPDPFIDTSYAAPSWDKARAQGNWLAMHGINALQSEAALTVEHAGINLTAKTVHFPVPNQNFRLGALLGVLKRGYSGWFQMKSEIAAFTIGPASFVTMPGEMYPEIMNGGVDVPEGADFSIEPVEFPPVRNVMPGEYKFLLGLANDEIGYILPKSQWDAEPPYTYGRESNPYGEIVSLGPETGPIYYRTVTTLLKELAE